MIDPRRRIPRTDDILADPQLITARDAFGPARIRAIVAAVQDRARSGELDPDAVLTEVRRLAAGPASSLQSVINATGIIVHTNLGRAPMSKAARAAIAAAAGATDVEFNLVSGARSRRGRGTLTALAEAVPTAESVHVVNNNAAALLLCALTLAPGKEIVLSRGEMVEIGDGFRIPELLAATGCALREVGTTNRTTLQDYQAAIGPATGFVLKVHPSNYRIIGFTSTVEVSDLARLEVPLVVDIGSGLLAPHPLLPDEPDASTVIRQGADVVTASGDKLLGGPQAGLLFGTAELIEQLRRHPAARALRVDKLTLAALEATIRGPMPPVLQALEMAESDLRLRAERLTAHLVDRQVPSTCVPCSSTTGGGSAPGVELPSWAISLPAELAAALRTTEVPVIGRVTNDRCLLDLRTVDPSDDNRMLVSIETAYDACR